ncbi:MAG: LysR family transcriptional regulator [Hyphomicrobiales bacterium]|nr:LysR family transcriptional regulator [Hyphomicrobiales bacterium]
MDAGDLLLLDAIITEGGVTAAAKKLRQPKATISRRLQRLEKAAGSPLFDRASRRLRPTLLGQHLAESAALVRVALAGAQTIIESVQKGEGGCLRVAAPFLFGRVVLSQFVGQFLAGAADLNITLKFSNDPIDPMRDEFDVAIQIIKPKVSYLVQTKLAMAELKLYAAPNIASMINQVSDLKYHRAVKTSNEPTEHLVLQLSDGNRNYKERLRVMCTVNDPEAACVVASSGAAVAALPEFLALSFVSAGQLKPLLPNLCAGTVEIFAVTPPGRLALPVVRNFVTALKKELIETRFAK